MTELLMDCDHFIAGAALIGGISYFHTYQYDLIAANERIIASSCDAAIAAKKAGGPLKKVTYMSSSMVFESTDRWPSKEGDELLVPPPLSSYGFQKLAVEYFARAAKGQYDIDFTILRPFNCVGIGESRALGDVEIHSGNVQLAMSHVVPDLVQKVLKGQDPLHILGEGNQVRHYTYGGDLARGIVLSAQPPGRAQHGLQHLDARPATPSSSSPRSSGARSRVRTCRSTSCSDPAFEYDVQKRVPDVTKAKEVLGFEATTTLEDMLDEVIPWIENAVADGTI